MIGNWFDLIFNQMETPKKLGHFRLREEHSLRHRIDLMVLLTNVYPLIGQIHFRGNEP